MLWIQRLREVTSEGSPLAGRCDTGGEIHSGAPGMVPLQPCLGAACASPCASLSTATMLRAAPAALGLCRGGYDRRPWKPRARACFKNRRMPATTATTALCCSITPCPSTRSLNPAPHSTTADGKWPLMCSRACGDTVRPQSSPMSGSAHVAGHACALHVHPHMQSAPGPGQTHCDEPEPRPGAPWGRRSCRWCT